MHNSKLFLLLKSIPSEEMHWFQKFLKSPFYNNNKITYGLFQHIQKYHPNLDHAKLTKEATFKKLFPKEAYKIQKLRKAMYELASLTEEFLIAMSLRKKEFEKKKLLVAALGDRNIHDQFKKGTFNLVEELESLPYRNIDFYKDMHFLHLHFFGHVATRKEKNDIVYLKKSMEHLDHYYLLQRQRLELSIQSSQRLYGKSFNISHLQQSQSTLQDEPIFKLYQLIIEALSTEDNEMIYQKIEEQFKNEIDTLALEDQLEVLRILLNFMSGKINNGNDYYKSRILSLYKFGLKKKLLIINGILSDMAFLNIATISIKQKDFKWAENFIKEYQHYLEENSKKDVVRLITGKFYFHQQAFDKTIELLINSPFDKTLYSIGAKILLLRTYFEQFLLNNSFYELLVDRTHSFEKYIRRNKLISLEKKEFYLNFILYIRKLANNILEGKIDENLYKNIKNSQSLVLKSWLLEKTINFSKQKKRFQ